MNRCYECESELTLVCQNCNTRPTPTRCVELETVAYYRVNRTHLTHIPHKGYDELVTRQNAEEVIVVERMKLEATARVGLQLSEKIEALEADLAAERAEKEQAKGDLTRVLVHFVREHFPENTTFKPFDDLIGLITQFDNASTIAREYASRIHVLEADNASLIHDLNRIKDHETKLINDNAAKDARIAELEAKLETANALVTCCCGSLVNDHDMGSGHSPVDQYHYAMVQLEADNKRLREALEPFANVAEHDIGDDEGDGDIFWPMSNARYSMAGRLRVGDLRHARAALGEMKP